MREARIVRLAVLSFGAIGASVLTAAPASANGCNGVVSLAEWGCAPWDNNNGPQYPYYQGSANPAPIRIAHDAPAQQATQAPTPPITAQAAPAPQVSSAPVATTPAGSAANLSTGYSSKRLAIKVVSQCPADPDPIGLVSSDMYSDCDQEELDKVRGWITSSLTGKSAFGSVGDENPDLVLTITLTQSMSSQGAAGMLTDLAPSTLKFGATYQLADSAGRVVKSGEVHHEADEAYFGGNEDEEEQKFAAKIADAVSPDGPVTGTSSRGAPATDSGDK